jgi:hypothetical protein|tara:strand:- start:116 stop:460 length:345 start_codon:yes stop_codon:yes gene_type:complete
MLDRDAILNVVDLKPEVVEVPEWGGSLYIRMLTASERDKFEASCVGTGKKQNLTNIRARLVVLCACDEAGERLFTDADAEALGRKSAAAVDKVFGACSKLNGFSSQDIEDLEGE